jgi:hypothetical protein
VSVVPGSFVGCGSANQLASVGERGEEGMIDRNMDSNRIGRDAPGTQNLYSEPAERAILQFTIGWPALPRARQLAAKWGLTLENHGGFFRKRITVRGEERAIKAYADALEAWRRAAAQEW